MLEVMIAWVKTRVGRVGAAILLTSMVALCGCVSPVSAVSSDSKMFISSDNVFYAYVKGGETLEAAFTRTDAPNDAVSGVYDVTATLSGPGITEQTCTIPKTVAIGKGCAFSTITAPQSGIFKVTFSLPSDAKPFEQLSPSIRWGGNLFSWNITVHDGETEKTGRVWSTLYAINQPSADTYLANPTLYFMSESGYMYKAAYTDYNGQLSTLSADAVGIRQNEKCTSAYRSIEVSDTQYSPSFGSCGGGYKLFFEYPSGDLPASAKTADGTTDWINPTPVNPEVSDLTFTKDSNTSEQSGKITFSIRNFIGQYVLKIDTDGDGSYDGAADISYQKTIKTLAETKQSITFNGIDAQSKPVLPSQTIGIKIDIQKVAEIHLVSSDVEGRGGLELTRLNGTNAPTTRMCWDDTNLSSLSDSMQSYETKLADGRDCPDSTGGVHGWAYATGSWGDVRYIDDWAYATTPISGTAGITYAPATTIATVASKINIALVAILAIFGLCIAAVVVVVTARKRKAHKAWLVQVEKHDVLPEYNDDQHRQPPQPPLSL